jgi:hypothetical protein
MSLKLSLNTILLSPMLHEGGKVVLCILPAYEVPSEFFREFPCIFEGVVRETAAADSSGDGIDGAPSRATKRAGDDGNDGRHYLLWGDYLLHIVNTVDSGEHLGVIKPCSRQRGKSTS